MLGSRLHRRIACRTTYYQTKKNSYLFFLLKHSDHNISIMYTRPRTNTYKRLLNDFRLLIFVQNSVVPTGFVLKNTHTLLSHVHCCRFGLRHGRLIGSVKNIIHIFYIIEFVLFSSVDDTARGKILYEQMQAIV